MGLQGVKKENISAVYQDGLLKVTLPKKEEACKTAEAKKTEIQ